MSTTKQPGLEPRSASRSRKKAKRPKKAAGWGRRILVFLLVLLLLAAAYLAYLVFAAKDAIDTIGNPDAAPVPEEQSVKVKPVTFLLLGLDGRANGGGMNTDVIKIVSMNPKSKSATVVSVPRDAKIEFDGYKSNKANAYYANFYSQAIKDKNDKDLAHAYARQETKEMFGKLFGIPIDYTAVINFNGFSDVVEALGGVQVDVDMNMCYYDSVDGTNINLTAGPQTLNGKQALDYVRYRQSHKNCSPRTKDSSDFERNKRQTQVIGAIADKMISLGAVTKVGKVIGAVGSNMKSDIHRDEIENLIAKYFGMGSGSIESLPLEGTWRSPYVYLDAGKLQEAKAALNAKLDE
ncbi:LCP family protein [Paenibacillus tarimensis]